MRTWLRRVLWAFIVALIVALVVALVALLLPQVRSHQEKPAWCRALPRPEYQALERVSVSDPWFEVYRVAPGVLAIYEPHQAEEVISYLIIGSRQAALFDTGMGISDIQKVTAELTRLPLVVVNSHTHHDHVGGNWQFKDVLGMDTEFTRASARGTTAGAQDEIAPDMICGALPNGFDSRSYATRPWTITRWIHDGDRLDLGDRVLEVLSTPGHTPDAVSLLDREHGLLFTGDTYYPAPIWLFRPETDLDAYATSIQRLAALASHLTTVLGAHNVPIAPPQILLRLVSAFGEVRSGRVQPTTEGGRNVYRVGEISFVMRAGARRRPRLFHRSGTPSASPRSTRHTGTAHRQRANVSVRHGTSTGGLRNDRRHRHSRGVPR
jgi:glyoxylase-like metal-dependent hydrolase (beta-lactamase superfamily II)